MRKWGPTAGDKPDPLSVEESETEDSKASLFTGDHVCVQCDHCKKWRHLDSEVHETDYAPNDYDLKKYMCHLTVFKDTLEPVGLSCEEQEQNCAPPNREDPYASESYDVIYYNVESFVYAEMEHPPMPLDPAGYPASEPYQKWLKKEMVGFMTDSYHEYLGYIGRIHPEGTVPPS